jgi:hypothetical protein
MPPMRLVSFLLGVLLVAGPYAARREAPRPDEGMWLPTQVREMDWEALKRRGLELTKDEFWHPTEGGVLTAAVQISGCSASFCSPDGLVVTNHHCGFGAVEALSTPDNNRLHDGYAAASLEDELPARGMTVYVVRKIENVTERVRKAADLATEDAQRAEFVDREIKAIVEEGEKEPNTTCSVASFLNGVEYHLYYRTKIEDVRLAYAPPRAIGEYGGETDNWEWPRHTGDFMFFRAYVAPDGTPRPFDKANVPYKPKHYLKPAKKGVEEGDLVMVLGYPGRTQRYLTSEGVRGQEEKTYPLRLELSTAVVAALEEASKESPAKALKLSTTIKSIANVQKNALGMVKGLARNKTLARKASEEAEFAKWVQADTGRRLQYGSLLSDMQAFEAGLAQTALRDTALQFALGRTNPLLGSAVNYVAQLQRVEDGSGRERTAEAAGKGFASEAVGRDFESIQLPILAACLDAARRAPEDERLADGLSFYASGKPGREGAAQWLAATKLASAKAREELVAGGAEAIEKSDDPLIELAKKLAVERSEFTARQKIAEGRRLDLGRRWIEAQQAWRGKAFYPDANSTLRVSIATVRGYSPRDGAVYVPRTTVAGLLDKHTGVEPFDAPEALRKAATTRQKSAYFDPKLGDVPVCFLSDADTTGGNSGSCVINGKGELVGLNFDRVFENVAGDFGWSTERSRNVVCDIRYAMWCVESVLPCPRLLKELGG